MHRSIKTGEGITWIDWPYFGINEGGRGVVVVHIQSYWYFCLWTIWGAIRVDWHRKTGWGVECE